MMMTVYEIESGAVFGDYYTLSDAYQAVLDNADGQDIDNCSGMAFRVHENGTIIGRVTEGALKIETGMGGGRDFNWVETLGIKLGSKEIIVARSLERLGLTSDK